MFWNHNHNIRADSKLKVHIVDAVNLQENIESYVKVQQGHCESQTNLRVGAGPIWNEAIVFNIEDPEKVVNVMLVDSSGRTLFSR